MINFNEPRRKDGATVGASIRIDGRVWGVIHATRRAAFAPDSKSKLAGFAELAAPAIAYAEARATLARLETAQAAVRRVAALVAQGQRPDAVSDAVADELTGLLAADQVLVGRYERARELTVLAHRGAQTPPGARVSDDGVEAAVRATERCARMESREDARVAVAAPIVVAGRLWGVISGRWERARSPSPETEWQIAEFAQVLASAVANADATASRARLLSAADAARRRVVGDLHDGAQQRLVQTVMTLKLAQQALRVGEAVAARLIDEALAHAEQGTTELRELAHGILPTVLTKRGLRSGVQALAERSALAVRIEITAERFPAEIEASAYFIVAEALTNVIKHARATRAEVTASVERGTLHVRVRDDGVGGADAAGHGLIGLGDRATALGGRLSIESPPGGGTLVSATLPLARMTR